MQPPWVPFCGQHTRSLLNRYGLPALWHVCVLPHFFYFIFFFFLSPHFLILPYSPLCFFRCIAGYIRSPVWVLLRPVNANRSGGGGAWASQDTKERHGPTLGPWAEVRMFCIT